MMMMQFEFLNDVISKNDLIRIYGLDHITPDRTLVWRGYSDNVHFRQRGEFYSNPSLLNLSAAACNGIQPSDQHYIKIQTNIIWRDKIAGIICCVLSLLLFLFGFNLIAILSSGIGGFYLGEGWEIVRHVLMYMHYIKNTKFDTTAPDTEIKKAEIESV